MSETYIQFKLIRADFMVSKAQLERISEEVAKASKKGMRLTKSKIVRMALDQFLFRQQELGEAREKGETISTDWS